MVLVEFVYATWDSEVVDVLDCAVVPLEQVEHVVVLDVLAGASAREVVFRRREGHHVAAGHDVAKALTREGLVVGLVVGIDVGHMFEGTFAAN